MKLVAVALSWLLAMDVLVAQSRSAANAVQRGGAPNIASLLVGLVPAKTIALPGDVDSNSPAVWDLVGGQNTMIVLTSFAGRPSRALGSLAGLTPAMPVALHPWPGGGVWLEAVVPAHDGTWYGYYHNEIVATECGDESKVVPRIGAARSTDHGATWVDLGILMASPSSSYVCNTHNRYFVGGVGDLSVVLDRNGQFLYMYFSEYGPTGDKQGVGVARMAWGDRDNPIGRLDVWNHGAWLPMRGVEFDDATPIFLSTRHWHDADSVVDAYWGPTVHWNEYLERYVMLLNRAADESFSQEGIYLSMTTNIEEPASWSPPTKIMDGGQWYPQVIGTEEGLGTDKLAGREARFFVSGRSEYVIRFNKAGF